MTRRQDVALAAAGGLLGALLTLPLLVWAAYTLEQRAVHKRAVKR